MQSLKASFKLQRMISKGTATTTGEVKRDEVERVLAVPRADLERAGLLTRGFSARPLEDVIGLVLELGEFLERDPAWKQIIPYCLVCAGTDVLLLQRSSRGGESRLHLQLSGGVGGHVNPEPVEADRRVLTGLERELREELDWGCGFSVHELGILNDDSNDVGRVHFGLVYLVRAQSREVRVREVELLSGEFVSVETLGRRRDQMEPWSRYVVDALIQDELLARSDRGTLSVSPWHPAPAPGETV